MQVKTKMQNVRLELAFRQFVQNHANSKELQDYLYSVLVAAAADPDIKAAVKATELSLYPQINRSRHPAEAPFVDGGYKITCGTNYSRNCYHVTYNTERETRNQDYQHSNVYVDASGQWQFRGEQK